MIKTLLGIRLRSALINLIGGKSKNGKSRVSTGRVIAVVIAYLYVIAVFGGMFSLLAAFTAPLMISAGLDWFYFAMFTVVAFAMVFVLSIFETKSQLFECKDNELLLSMPIKPRDIVISRIFTVLIFNYFETLLVMLPAIICYIVFGGSVNGIIGSIIVTLLLPLLATSLSSGVGYAVALLAKRFKKNNFVTVGISLVFLLLYFWGYSALMGSIGEGETPDLVALGSSLSGMSFIGEASLLHPIFTPVYAAISIGSAFVAYFLISKSYISIVTATSGSKKKEYKVSACKNSSQFAAIAKKEFSRFLSSSTYMLNSAIGIIFTVLISIAIFLNRESLSLVVSELSAQVGIDLFGALAAGLCSLVVLTSGLNIISASALSLEGKSFWILRSMPVSAGTFLLAKTVPAVLIPLLPNLIASVFVIITARADFIHSLLIIIIPQIAGIVSALLGIVINALFPKFEFESEVQVVKQSMATFLAMLATTLYGFLNIALAVVFSLILGGSILSMLMMLLLGLIISAVMLVLLLGPIKRKYDKYSI